VLLQNDHASSRGNVALDDLGVADPGFQITGMTGGRGGDCPGGIGCASNDDCLSGLCHADHRCQ
jgi:hypothetical protein